MLSEIFKCGLCSQFLVDPVTLKCNGQNVCASHLKLSENSLVCNICHESHEKPKKSEISKALEIDPMLSISEAKVTLQKMSKRDPQNLVYKYYEDIRCEVDLRREKLKFEIDEYSDELTEALKTNQTGTAENDLNGIIQKYKAYGKYLIQSITSTQKECKETLKKMNQRGLKVDDTAETDLKKVIDQYDQFEIDRMDFEKVNRQILELKLQCDKMLEDYEEAVQMRRQNSFSSKKSSLSDTSGTSSIGLNNQSFDSKIVPCFEVKLNQLCHFPSNQQWKLIYRGSRDGFSAKAFHSKCDGIENTLTVVQSTNGNVFGGFTTKLWNSGGWFEDTRAFIFSLVNNENKPFRRGNCYKGYFAIWGSPQHGPCFGDGDICIASGSNVNMDSFSNFGMSYKHKSYKCGTARARSIIAGSNLFRTKEIEVFRKIKE